MTKGKEENIIEQIKRIREILGTKINVVVQADGRSVRIVGAYLLLKNSDDDSEGEMVNVNSLLRKPKIKDRMSYVG